MGDDTAQELNANIIEMTETAAQEIFFRRLVLRFGLILLPLSMVMSSRLLNT